jgi:hypothetical protein
MHPTRRSVLAALPIAAACGGAASAPTSLYVAPDGAGDGASWADAAALTDLDDLLRRAGPGGEVAIAADAGPYDLEDEIPIASGGRRDRLIRVHGVNRTTGAPQAAVLRGGAEDGDGAGQEGFRLLRGANHLHFSHLAFERFGNGCFRVAAPMTGLVIEDCSFDRVYRFLENTISGDETSADLRDFAVRRCRGRHTVRGFLRVRYGSRGGVVEDCAAHGVAHEGDDFPTGCVLEDRAGDIVYRRCMMDGFQQVHGGDYWNGDGFSDEAENFGVRYERCVARGSTDGGFDCKSRNVVLEHCIAEDNKRNFRIWSERGTLISCVSRAPNFRGAGEESADACHVWIGGERAPVVTITNLTIEDRDASSIFSIENDDVRVQLSGLTLHSPRANWGDGRVRRTAGPVTTITPQ